VAGLGPRGSDPEAARAVSNRRSWDLAGLCARYGTLFFLLALLVLFTSLNQRFIAPANLLNIVQSISQLAILASGLSVCLVMLDFDLSISWNAAFAGVIAAGVARDSHSTYGAFAVGILVATFISLLNGLVITKLLVSAFIATLAMGVIVEGLMFWYAQGQTITLGLPPDFSDLGRASFLGIRFTIIVMFAVLAVLWVVLEHTEVGRFMYAIGGNREAARLSGINIDRTRVLALLISGTCAGITGVLLASNFGAGNPQAGGSLLLDAFTAAFLGASVLRGGQFHIFGTLIGAIVLGVLTNGLTFINIPFEYQSIAKGLILIAAVAISTTRR